MMSDDEQQTSVKYKYLSKYTHIYVHMFDYKIEHITNKYEVMKYVQQ